MAFSLVVAFVVTPWAAVRLLSPSGHHRDDGKEDLLTRLYRRVMGPLITSGRTRAVFFACVAVLLLAAVALVPLGLVTVKMMPFDNKSEFQVVVDMPEGTALETTARVASALAAATLEDETVVNVQQYVGVSAPYNFNGLVRHYFLRRAPHLADLQVNLVPKGDRSAQSHDIAGRVRDRLLPLATQLGATIQVAEVPPGPPVLQTLVAEVYGPDPARRMAVAARIKSIFEKTPGVVDTDWYVEAPHPKITLGVDGEKAAAAGLSPAAVAAVVRMAASGESAGLLHDERAREDVPIVIRLPRGDRSLEAVQSIRLHGTRPVAVGELTSAATTEEGASLYHKNLQAVTYVTGDLAGRNGSPVYAILQMNDAIARLSLPEGYGLEVFNAAQPFDTSRYAMKWDGEWHLTIEVFRDLGLAFAAVLVLIYVLVVGWFQSFTTPLVIMAAIPFSLVGVLPAHVAMGAFFTATSMIGFIAGAGIVVRNSIILVDFIELRLREGLPLEQAVVDAGAVRFRPMALTAAAMIVGAGVILFDPIFQGLAVSLMAGEVASLLLSRMAVPVLYYLAKRHTRHASVRAAAPMEAVA
jgi:multidrug efflux pump subunit AcrB